ncbi:MAG TPA: polyprenyl synthetase family protein [Microbacteriaceae bacterium]
MSAHREDERRSSPDIQHTRRLVSMRVLRELEGIRGVGDLTSRFRRDHNGSRARTTLTLLAAQFGTGANDGVVRAAALIELEHLASVFHSEDVVDTRAQPVDGSVTPLKSGVELDRSNSLATICGDVLLSRANRLATSLGPRAIELLAEMMERLCVGKLHAEDGPRIGENAREHYLRTLAATSGNTFGTAARLGLIFSGAPTERETPVVAFAERAGVAFQLVEDCLRVCDSAASREKGAADALEARRWSLDAKNALKPLPECSATRALSGFADTIVERLTGSQSGRPTLMRSPSVALNPLGV